MGPQIWDKDEEIRFLKEISSGKSMDDIARGHDRSASALDLRLKKIIFDNVTAGKTEESMAKILNMPIDKVKQYFYEYKGFLEKKGKLDDVVHEVQANTGTVVAAAPRPVQTISAPTVQTPQIKQSANKPIITNPAIKPANIVLTGGKEVITREHRKHHTSVEATGAEVNDKYGRLLGKIRRIDRENNYMKSVLDNIEMRKRVNGLIDEGVLDKKFKRLFRSLSRQQKQPVGGGR